MGGELPLLHRTFHPLVWPGPPVELLEAVVAVVVAGGVQPLYREHSCRRCREAVWEGGGNPGRTWIGAASLGLGLTVRLQCGYSAITVR